MGPAPDALAGIRSTFFAECEELLERLLDALAAPDFGQPGDDRVHVAFRAVHTIKGGAASLGHESLAGFAHGFEERLALIRAGACPTEAERADLARDADHLADRVAAAQQGPAAATAPGALPQATGETGAWRVTFRPANELFNAGNEPLFLLKALCGLGAAEVACDLSTLPPLDTLEPEAGYLAWTITLAGPVEPDAIRACFDFVEGLCELTIAPAAGQPHERVPSSPAEGADPAATIRVNLDRIERLMNLASELVIGQSVLVRAVATDHVGQQGATKLAIQKLAALTRDLQGAVMELRTQPVKPLFQRMARLLREAADKLGKDILFETEGEATEIDRVMIERLTEPLTHLIRNAADHGLERPDERRLTGKAGPGRIRLTAAHRSGRVVIELSDDGRGIDRARVRAIAEARDLVDPSATLTAAEIDELLFRPGFSTASEVTEISGRGVGLDAVRAAIAGLGGRVGISSAPGLGTRFTISLPLTLAVMDGLLARVGSQTLVVPLASTLETAMLSTLAPYEDDSGDRRVRLRGQPTALVELADLLGFAPRRAGAPDPIAVLIADEEDRRLALVVDDVIDQAQVVIKNLGRSCGQVPGAQGATILGDGQVALILDPPDLIRRAAERSFARAEPERLTG